MNFLTTLFFVILTSGIHIVQADWAEDRQRLGIHFLAFIAEFERIALNAVPESRKEQIRTVDATKIYGKLTDQSEPGYVKYGATFAQFKFYTEERIGYFTKSAMTEDEMERYGEKIQAAIARLANAINTDSYLGIEYILEDLYVYKSGGTTENFRMACPLARR